LILMSNVESWKKKIWYGWAHLAEPIDLDSETIFDAYLYPYVVMILDEKSKVRTEKNSKNLWRFIEILKKTDKKLVFLDDLKKIREDQRIYLSYDQVSDLMYRVSRIFLNIESYIIRRRFLEVLALGNEHKRFIAVIPYDPVPLPPPPRSPHQHVDAERYLSIFPPLVESFVESLTLGKPPETFMWWGRIYLSAMLFGGLVVTKSLLALPNAIREKQCDSAFRWVDLAVEKKSGKNLKESEGGNFQIQRWIPDPLTRYILLKDREQISYDGIKEGYVRSDSHLKRCIQKYAAWGNFKLHLPNEIRELKGIIWTHMFSYMPPDLIYYSFGRSKSTSLRKAAWDRCISPPKRISMRLNYQTPPSKMGAGYARGKVVIPKIDKPPKQFQDLERILSRGSKSGGKDRTLAWIKENEGKLLPSVQLIAEWIVDWLFVEGKHNPDKAIGLDRARELASTMGRFAVSLLGDMNPLEFNEDGFVELYSVILEEEMAPSTRITVSQALRSWHMFLAEEKGAVVIDLDDVLPVLRGVDGKVDANLITPSGFLLAQDWIRSEGEKRHDAEIAEAMSLVLAAGFYLGLRRSEAIGLQLTHFIGSGTLFLHLHPEGVLGLKTKNSERYLPLAVLMPPEQYSRFLAWYERRRKYSKEVMADPLASKRDKGLSLYLFSYFVTDEKLKNSDPRLVLLFEGLQRATHDPTIRFHHLRHSFANWTLMKFALYEISPRESIPEWFLANEEDRQYLKDNKMVREFLLGSYPTNRRSLLQVTRLLGHAGFETTLGSYTHLMDLLLGMYCRRLLPDFTAKQLSLMLDVTESHARTLLTIELNGNEVDYSLKLASVLEQRCGRFQHIEKDNKNKKIDSVRPEEKLLLISKVSGLFLEENAVQISQELGCDIKGVSRWIDNLKELPDGIGNSNANEKKTLLVELPQGRKQKELAQNIAAKINDLRCYGDKPNFKEQATRNRINQAIDFFMCSWKGGTSMTVQSGDLPKLKKWFWLLEKLDLYSPNKCPQNIIVNHYSATKQQGATLNEDRQIDYWCNNLGVTINTAKIRKKSDIPIELMRARGAIDVKVPSSVITQTVSDKSSKLMVAVRLALVAEWVDSNS
jgi:integrase